jgi:hypothetical protein
MGMDGYISTAEAVWFSRRKGVERLGTAARCPPRSWLRDLAVLRGMGAEASGGACPTYRRVVEL